MSAKTPGFAIWITGLPASGKSTLTAAVVEMLSAREVAVQVLESDVVRHCLTPELGYGGEDRERFYRLLLAIGELLVKNGVNVIFDATAAERRFREEARKRLPRFIEVYVHCPLEMCEERDPKHIYEKARQGVYADVPGIQAAYEPPLKPEVEIDTTRGEIAEEAERVVIELSKQGFLEKG
jgi:adenylylsulfate kinase